MFATTGTGNGQAGDAQSWPRLVVKNTFLEEVFDEDETFIRQTSSPAALAHGFEAVDGGDLRVRRGRWRRMEVEKIPNSSTRRQKQDMQAVDGGDLRVPRAEVEKIPNSSTRRQKQDMQAKVIPTKNRFAALETGDERGDDGARFVPKSATLVMVGKHKGQRHALAVQRKAEKFRAQNTQEPETLKHPTDNWEDRDEYPLAMKKSKSKKTGAKEEASLVIAALMTLLKCAFSFPLDVLQSLWITFFFQIFLVWSWLTAPPRRFPRRRTQPCRRVGRRRYAGVRRRGRTPRTTCRCVTAMRLLAALASAVAGGLRAIAWPLEMRSHWAVRADECCPTQPKPALPIDDHDKGSVAAAASEVCEVLVKTGERGYRYVAIQRGTSPRAAHAILASACGFATGDAKVIVRSLPLFAFADIPWEEFRDGGIVVTGRLPGGMQGAAGTTEGPGSSSDLKNGSSESAGSDDDDGEHSSVPIAPQVAGKAPAKFRAMVGATHKEGPGSSCALKKGSSESAGSDDDDGEHSSVPIAPQAVVKVKLPWNETIDVAATNVSRLKEQLKLRSLDVDQIFLPDDEDSESKKPLPDDELVPEIVKISLNSVPAAHVGCGADWVPKLPRGVEDLPMNFRQLGKRILKTEERAISWRQLQELGDFVSTLLREVQGFQDPRSEKPLAYNDTAAVNTAPFNMYNMDEILVKKLTIAFRCSFVELVATGPQPPLLFMSHAWSTPFEQTLLLLKFYFAERSKKTALGPLDDVCVWICTFANNQHDLGELAGDLEASPFVRAIRNQRCLGTVVVLDGDVTPFKRVWCVLEAKVSLQACEAEVSLQECGSEHRRGQRYFYDLAAWLPDDTQFFGGKPVSARPAALLDLGEDTALEVVDRSDVEDFLPTFPNEVAKRAALVDVENAEAARKDDKQNIIEYIENHGGIESLNRLVGRRFVATAAYYYATEGNVDALNRLLDRYGLSDIMKGMSTNGSTPVFAAAWKGHADCLRHLLNVRADANKAQTTTGCTPVWQAAQNGHDKCVLQLLEARADPDKATTDDGSTPMFMAAQNGHDKCLLQLLEARADPHKAKNDDTTPLCMAAYEGHEVCVQQLLDIRADPEKADDLGGTPLYWAASNGHDLCLQKLLDIRADPKKARTTDGATPTFAAAHVGHDKCVLQLLEARADPDKAKNDGATPLFVAAQNGHDVCLKQLLEVRADPEKARTTDGTTPTIIAANNGHDKCLLQLLEARADPDKAQTTTGCTPVWQAAQNGHDKCVLQLLEARADPDKANNNGCTPLFMAAQNGHDVCLKQLLEVRADPEKASNDGATPVFQAAQSGHQHCLQLLLTRRADVEKAMDDGCTPMLSAAQQGRDECVRVLLEHRVDPDKPCPGSYSPAELAWHHTEATGRFRELLEMRADPWSARTDGCTPLIMAAVFGRDACLARMLEARADPQIAKDNGTTAATMAARYGNPGCLLQLLAARADPNSGPDEDGHTPMTAAVEQGNEVCLQHLLAVRADPSKATKLGSAEAIAEQGGHEECLRLLRGQARSAPLGEALEEPAGSDWRQRQPPS